MINKKKELDIQIVHIFADTFGMEPSEKVNDINHDRNENKRLIAIEKVKDDFIHAMTPQQIAEWRNDNTNELRVVQSANNGKYFVILVNDNETKYADLRAKYTDMYSYSKQEILEELLYKSLIDE